MSDSYFVYRAYDGAGRLLYVGCTNNPAARMSAHAAGSLWYTYSVRVEVSEPMPKDEARGLEYEQINTLSPAFGRTSQKQREHMRRVRAIYKFTRDWNSQTIPHDWDASLTDALAVAELPGREYRPELDLIAYRELAAA